MPGILSNSSADAVYSSVVTELTARQINFAKLWEYYEGDQKRFLKVREGEPDYNVTVNLCARVIDQSINFMLGKLPKFDLPGEDDTQQAGLDAWCRAADIEEFLNDLFVNAAVTGHAFVKLMPDTALGVRPVVLDSGIVSVAWNKADKGQVLGYVVTWQEDGERYREDHWKVEGRWEVVYYTGSGSGWIEQSRGDWPYDFPQICDWKNLPNPRSYYGKSDIQQVVNLNDAYNFRVSNTNKILYIHAHPRTIGLGLRKEDVQSTSIDGFWAIPDKDASIQNLEMESDLESSRLQAQEMKNDFFSDASTVDLAVVKDKAGALTNFGLKLLFTEALAKNAKKRMLAGRGLSEMFRRVGVMLGLNWAGVTVQWADPLPENKTEQIANAKETIAMGVASRQTEAERLDYDWEREKQRRAEEQQAAQMGAAESLAAALTRFDRGEDAQ